MNSGNDNYGVFINFVTTS